MTTHDVASPALPWGAHPAGQQPQHEPVDVDVVAKMTLALPCRVEVKWEIQEVEEEGAGGQAAAASVKWWGASLDGAAVGERDGEGRQCYALRYDAHDGFAEETRHVTFLDEHTLYDLEDDDELLWRREGEAWDAPPEEEGAGGGEEAVQLNDVLAELTKAERRRGKTAEQECMELVSTLPADQQRFVVSGFTDFSENLAAGIKALMQGKGEGYVVTEEDMRAIANQAMQAARERMAGALP